MKMHGVPIVGEVRFPEAIAEICRVTEQSMYEGLTTIYILYPLEAVTHAGALVSGVNEDVDIEIMLYDANKNGGIKHLYEDDVPAILINGWIADEYNFAAVLLHEIGHYHLGHHLAVNDMEIEDQERQANQFSKERLKESNLRVTDVIIPGWEG